MQSPASSPASSKEDAIRAQFIRAAASRDLLFFSRYVERGFQDPAHVRLIASKLEAVASGKIKRLIINLPPRHGKSNLCSKYFPVWFLARKPSAQLIVASYAATLAHDFTRWQRNLVTSNPYFADLFSLPLRDDSRAVDRWETTAGGVVVGAGVGGPITGRGADLALIDDPVKNFEDATSPAIQDKIWDWFNSTLRTRLHPGAAIVIVMTRWTEDDLTGRLLKNEGERWDIVKLPAINSAGVPLWPERYSLEALREIKETITHRIWSALYQQEPTDLVERVFSDPQFFEAPSDLKLIGYLDPALGGADYSALTVGGFRDGKFYIAGGWIWQEQLDETYRRTVALCRAHNVAVLCVESNQAQIAIANELKRRGLQVKAVNQLKNKHFRIVHNAKKHWHRIRFAHTVTKEYMDQVLQYSEVARHDDAPDSLAGLIQSIATASKPQMRMDLIKVV